MDFGIDRLPDADTKNFNMNSYPVQNSSITLNSTNGGPGKLTGTDPEDGNLSDGATMIINTVPMNTELYYNNVLVTNGTVIPNYNSNLLTLKFTTLGAGTVTFTYSIRDAAGKQDPTPALYTINNFTVLPIKSITLTAKPGMGNVQLKWRVEGETDSRNYVVERSENGNQYVAIAEVAANNNGLEINNYAETDKLQGVTSSLVYYRIRHNSNDNRITYSATVPVRLDLLNVFNVMPTIISNEFNIRYLGNQQKEMKVSLIGISGKLIMTKTMVFIPGTTTNINHLDNLAAGTYNVILEDTKTYNKIVYKIVKQ
jgi:hypothetical protein